MNRGANNDDSLPAMVVRPFGDCIADLQDELVPITSFQSQKERVKCS